MLLRKLGKSSSVAAAAAMALRGPRSSQVPGHLFGRSARTRAPLFSERLSLGAETDFVRSWLCCLARAAVGRLDRWNCSWPSRHHQMEK